MGKGPISLRSRGVGTIHVPDSLLPMIFSLPSWHTKVLIAAAALLFVSGGYLAYVRTLGGAVYARREIDSIRADISQLRRDNARLRSQLAGISEKLGSDPGGFPNRTTFPTGKAPGEIPARLAARVSKLKDYLSAHPELSDPEMRLLKDDDWVMPVKEERLETEAGTRKALSQVRAAALGRLGEMVAAAIRDYADANNGQQPSSVTQIAPFLSDQANSDLLQGFGKPDSTAPVGCLFQKTSTVDSWYDSACFVWDDQFACSGTGPGVEVERAIVSYQRATGNPPNDASQIIPYLQYSISPVVVGAVLDGLRPSPNAPPALSANMGGSISIGGSGKPE